MMPVDQCLQIFKFLLNFLHHHKQFNAIIIAKPATPSGRHELAQLLVSLLPPLPPIPRFLLPLHFWKGLQPKLPFFCRATFACTFFIYVFVVGVQVVNVATDTRTFARTFGLFHTLSQAIILSWVIIEEANNWVSNSLSLFEIR
jgi:hypothetical protein